MHEFKVLSVVIMLLLGVSGGSVIHAINNQQECWNVAGEVIGKDNSEGLLVLYVVFYDNGDREQYKVFVGPETYESYSVGEVYEEEVCDIQEYNKLHELIDSLMELGLLQPS